jgi:hypothetical protein
MYHANNAVKSGLVECALALGFEKMAPGSLATHWPDREPPLELLNSFSREIEVGPPSTSVTQRMFSGLTYARTSVAPTSVLLHRGFSRMASKSFSIDMEGPWSILR